MGRNTGARPLQDPYSNPQMEGSRKGKYSSPLPTKALPGLYPLGIHLGKKNVTFPPSFNSRLGLNPVFLHFKCVEQILLSDDHVASGSSNTAFIANKGEEHWASISVAGAPLPALFPGILFAPIVFED